MRLVNIAQESKNQHFQNSRLYAAHRTRFNGSEMDSMKLIPSNLKGNICRTETIKNQIFATRLNCSNLHGLTVIFYFWYMQNIEECSVVFLILRSLWLHHHASHPATMDTGTSCLLKISCSILVQGANSEVWYSTACSGWWKPWHRWCKQVQDSNGKHAPICMFDFSRMNRWSFCSCRL